MDNHELQLIACCLLDNDLINQAVLQGMEYNWFTNGTYRQLWIGIVKRYCAKGEVDIMWATDFLKTKLNKGSLGQWVVDSSHAIGQIIHPRSEVMTALEIMKRAYDRKQLRDIILDGNKSVHLEEPTVLANRLIELLTRLKRVNGESDDTSIKDHIIEKLNRSIDAPTGFAKLDWMIKGIEPCVSITIGGFTSNGKTTFVLNVAMNLAQQSHPVTIFSTEMNEVLLTERLATIFSGVNPSQMSSISDEQKRDFLEGVDRAQELPIEVCKTLSLSNIRLSVQKQKSKLYIVDYIQMIIPDESIENDVKRLGYITRELEIMSKEYNTCIIATSQFSRQHRHRDGSMSDPTLSSFRGSGEIEENTDIGILMYYPYQQASFEQQEKLKEDGKENLINIAVQKNRIHGLTGMFTLELDRKTMRMKEREDG